MDFNAGRQILDLSVVCDKRWRVDGGHDNGVRALSRFVSIALLSHRDCLMPLYVTCSHPYVFEDKIPEDPRL